MLDYRQDLPIDLDVTGGEPLLRADIIDILKATRMEGISATLITNGTLMTGQLARQVADLNIPVCISIDGCRKESHELLRGKSSFDLVTKGITTSLEAGARVRLSVTVHAGNQQEIEGVLELAVKSHFVCKKVLGLGHGG